MGWRSKSCGLLLATCVVLSQVEVARGAGSASSAPAARVSTGRVVSAKLMFTKGQSIRGLRFTNPAQLIIEEQEERDGSFTYFARMAGDFTALEDSVLILNRQDTIAKIEAGKLTQTFSVRIPITADRNPIELEALSPAGKTEPLSAVVVARFEKSSGGIAETLLTGWRSSVSLGPSLISHVETAAPSFSATSATVKVMVDRRIQGPWSLGILAYVTAIPISASIQGLAPTFMGVSLRAGYLTAMLRKPWSLTWNAGFYYTSLFGVEDTYGFTNIHGLQPIPYPTITRSLSSRSSLSLTPKFSPILATFPKGLLDHTQLALGLRYSRLITQKRSWFTTLDYSKFQSKVESGKVTSTSLSLAWGLGF